MRELLMLKEKVLYFLAIFIVKREHMIKDFYPCFSSFVYKNKKYPTEPSLLTLQLVKGYAAACRILKLKNCGERILILN